MYNNYFLGFEDLYFYITSLMFISTVEIVIRSGPSSFSNLDLFSRKVNLVTLFFKKIRVIFHQSPSKTRFYRLSLTRSDVDTKYVFYKLKM